MQECYYQTELPPQNMFVYLVTETSGFLPPSTTHTCIYTAIASYICSPPCVFETTDFTNGFMQQLRKVGYISKFHHLGYDDY